MRLSATKLAAIGQSSGFGNQLYDFAGQVPSLDLRFADNKSLVDAVTGASLVTFTRASSGTFVDSAGVLQTAATDVPRFDHNPTTGESLGLLVEEQRTNLLLQSENFGTTWTANNLLAFGSGSTLNALAAPDGQTTADLITENTSNSQHNVNQVSTTTGAKRFSVFAKQGPGARLLRLIDFNATDGAQGETYFNLSTGAVVSGPGAIQAFPNGWYRCSIQSTTTVTSTYFISIATSASAFTYTGDGTSGLYLWGAQLEAGAFPTSYIPTTTAAATRSADLASITGSAFSGFYRQDEGSFFCSTFAPKGVVVYGTGDTFDNTQYISVGSSNNVSIRSGGALSALLTAPISTTTVTNIAHGYATDNFAAVSNGGVISTDTGGAVPLAQVRLKLGSSAWDLGGGNNLNGHLRRLCYWPQRLGNQVLQSITQ